MKNIGDLQRMAREMQANMEKAQTELGALTVEGTAGGGAVRVVIQKLGGVTGGLKLPGF